MECKRRKDEKEKVEEEKRGGDGKEKGGIKGNWSDRRRICRREGKG